MNKNALVTGGSKGIGRAICERLYKDGFKVIIVDINEKQGLSLADDIKGDFIVCDLIQTDAVIQMIVQVLNKYGRIDVLVNNAGYQHVAPIEAFPQEHWISMLSLMLTTPFILTKHVFPQMKQNRWGRIINMGSVHSLVASANKTGYVAAKHGLLGLTRTAALEGGEYGITVNMLCPAYVRTQLVEDQLSSQAKMHNIKEQDVIEKVMLKNAAIKRLIEPDEIANIVSLLCSDAGSCISGASWTIDNGWTAQ